MTDTKDERITELERENERLLNNAKRDAWCWQAMLQLLNEHGIEPNSSDLLDAASRWKQGHLEPRDQRIAELEAELRQRDDQDELWRIIRVWRTRADEEFERAEAAERRADALEAENRRLREDADEHAALDAETDAGIEQIELERDEAIRRADALERERDALVAGLDRDTRSRYALIDRMDALERALRPFAEAVYNDNGDLTIRPCGIDEYYTAKRVYDRTALAQQEPNQPAPHDLYKTGDYDAPEVIKDDNGEVVLGLCRRCGRGEVDLEEPCDQPVQDGTVDTGGSLDGFIDDGLPEDHQPADQPAQDGERLDPYTLERAAQTQDVVNRCADRLWQIYPEAMPRTHSGRCNIVRAILEEAISNVQLSGQPTQDGGRLDPYTLNWLARRDDRIAKLETWGWEEHRIAVQRGKRIVREVERAEAAERRADALEGALRPFAEAAYDELDPDDPRAKPDKHAWEHPYAMDVKVGDFQHAAQVYYGYAGAVTDQPADAGEADKSVSLRQQISEAQEEVAAWPEWMTKSAKVHEASCCARAREAERERCAQVAYQQADYVVADDDKETSWDDGFRAGAKAAGRAIRRTDGNAGGIDE